MKKLLFLIFILSLNLYSQTTVFSDNFNTSQGSTFTTSGQIGSSSWNVNRSGADWGARIDNNILELTNDASSSNNANGWVFTYTNTTNFGSPFNPTLSSNTEPINYIFNMRQNRTDPGGFSSGSYGVAFIIGSTSNSPFNAGQGYAIVLGQSLSIDPIRFAKFNNGLSGTLTDIITATSPLNDIGNEYLSLALKYNPSNNSWELYGRIDGTSNFGDPADGNLALLGTATDNTYTFTSLSYLGAYWQGATGTNQTAYFDNVNVVMGNVLLPVQLTSFNFELLKNKVVLKWETATEVNNYGFEIERKYNGFADISNSSWEKIGFVKGNGNSNSPKYYSFVDKNLINGNYIYRLKQIDTDGGFAYSDALNVLVDYKPEVIDLKNYPNPFNPLTKIYYEIPEDGFVTLKVYDVLGNEVKTLVNEKKKAGSYEVGLDASGFSTGIYFSILQFGNDKVVRKMQLVK